MLSRVVFFILFFLPAPYFGFASTFVDLDIEKIQIQPPRLETKTPIKIVPTVRNLGSEEANNFTIGLKLWNGKKLIRTIPEVPVLSSLPRNGSGLAVPVDIHLLPEGDYTVEVTVDYGDRIKERNEKNNKLTKDFHVWQPAYRSVTYGYK